MDFVVSKENIQPLRGGRNATQLEVGLQAQHNPQLQEELLQQRQQFENAIHNYMGDDPLDHFYHYIYWVEQSYPKNGHGSNLPTLLEDCLQQFENDSRYSNDRRFCNLWIKYIDMQQNPTELYQLLYAKRIGIGFADMYKAWAYYYEAAGNYQRADMVFKLGKDELAQPFQELEIAHEKFIRNLGLQALNQNVDTKRLSDQRQALTKLQTYRSGQVGSSRVASTSDAGILPSTMLPHRGQPPNVFHDYRDILFGAGAPPTSILTAVKRDAPKENMMEAGVWSGVTRKTHKAHKASNIQIHEDVISPHDVGIQLRHDHVATTSEDWSKFKVPICVPDPYDANKIAMYCKKYCYADETTEFSIEEVRARRYQRTMKRQLSVGSEMDFQPLQCFPRNSPEINVPGAAYAPPLRTPIHSHASGIPPFDPLSTTDMHPMQFSSMPQTSQPYMNQNAQVYAHPTSPYHTHAAIHPSVSGISLLATPSRSHMTVDLPEPLQHMEPAPQHSMMVNLPPAVVVESTSTYLEPKSCANLSHDASSVSMRTFGDVPPPMIQPRVSPDISPTPFNYTYFWPQEEAVVEVQPVERPGFTLYEESPQIAQPPRPISAKGSTMKTPFNVLSYDELAETGSRGGFDIAAAAQPTDVARCLPIDDDNSMQGYGDSTTTELFGLGNMCVSTPNNKSFVEDVPACRTKMAKKLNFAGHALKPISEERSTFLSSLPPDVTDEQDKYHYNLSQNMKANADLRSKIGMHCDASPERTHYERVYQQQQQVVKEEQVDELVDDDGREYVPYPVLEMQPTDPFTNRVLEMFLAHVNFPGRHRSYYTRISGVPKLALKKDPCYIANERFLVDKLLGKGSYGNVYKATRCDTGAVVALKIQKPPNKWEFYICQEIQARLRDDPIKEHYMNVHRGYFSEQASVLMSDVHHGSLLDLINVLKIQLPHGQKLHLTIYLTIEMMKLVQALHQIKIIHADIKPDNFLIMLREERIELQLIDFGCSIDMALMPPNTAFTRKIKTDTFQCCEMKDDRPWNYHTDIFCIAATAHVLLLDHYIEVKKTDGYWQIARKIPRYFREDLWAPFFSSMMNMQHGLPDLRGIINEFNEALDQRELRSAAKNVINLLRKR